MLFLFNLLFLLAFAFLALLLSTLIKIENGTALLYVRAELGHPHELLMLGNVDMLHNEKLTVR